MPKAIFCLEWVFKISRKIHVFFNDRRTAAPLKFFMYRNMNIYFANQSQRKRNCSCKSGHRICQSSKLCGYRKKYGVKCTKIWL